jgi:TM2 domain-containing membrane protein YozV
MTSQSDYRIVVQCGACQKNLRAPATRAGKRVKCPCGAAVDVPKVPKENSKVTSNPNLNTSTQPSVKNENSNLIQCDDCNAWVSKRASTCPKCGSPMGAMDDALFASIPKHITGQTSASRPPSFPQPSFHLQTPAAGQNFCASCGSPHNPNQSVCLKCGVAISGGSSALGSGTKNKTTAGLLALLLGGLGLHKFYHGSFGWGILYLISILTFIPAIVGFIEGIAYLCMSDSVYNQKYNLTPPSAFKW